MSLKMMFRQKCLGGFDFAAAVSVGSPTFHKALVLGNEGRYWSNGMDLRYLDSCSPEEHLKLQRDTNQLMARHGCYLRYLSLFGTGAKELKR